MLKKILLLALLPAIAFAEELPAPVKAIEKQGITIIKTFDAPGGMKGYLGKYQDMGVTIYLTPDGKHAIISFSIYLLENCLDFTSGGCVWLHVQRKR
ncbi:hypothetical protein EIMP300_71520 [Escherichia coli]|uniref:Disulphide bond isomerase DsbC/G N-terminal domain-containing protein n=1 Tax=Escherichia coli TaxID=562 RepID=A0A8S0FZD0_ECOLX|nr:hypothetical protein EIMP300_71520 [Escherichia coli]